MNPMSKSSPQEKCCVRCAKHYLDINQTITCGNSACPCHQPIVKEEDILTKELIRQFLGAKANIDYERNHSHYHCWDQNQPPACGIKLKDHKQCCLCDTPTSPQQSCCEKCKDKNIIACFDCPCHSMTTEEEKLTNEFIKEFPNPYDTDQKQIQWWLDKLHSLLQSAREECKPEIEHCAEPSCPECNLAAYNKGRQDERDKVRQAVEKAIEQSYEWSPTKPEMVLGSLKKLLRDIFSSLQENKNK